MTRWLGLCSSCLAALLVSGCDGSDSGDGTIGAKYRGIYRVDTFTESPDCSMEGGSVLAGDRDHLLIATAVDRAGDRVDLVGCAEPAKCRDFHRRGEGVIPFNTQFRTDKGDHLEGGMVTSGFLEAGVCQEAEVERATLKLTSSDAIRLELRAFPGEHPPDADGFCSTADTLKAAEGRPCVRLRVITATRIEAL